MEKLDPKNVLTATANVLCFCAVLLSVVFATGNFSIMQVKTTATLDIPTAELLELMQPAFRDFIEEYTFQNLNSSASTLGTSTYFPGGPGYGYDNTFGTSERVCGSEFLQCCNNSYKNSLEYQNLCPAPVQPRVADDDRGDDYRTSTDDYLTSAAGGESEGSTDDDDDGFILIEFSSVVNQYPSIHKAQNCSHTCLGVDSADTLYSNAYSICTGSQEDFKTSVNETQRYSGLVINVSYSDCQNCIQECLQSLQNSRQDTCIPQASECLYPRPPLQLTLSVNLWKQVCVRMEAQGIAVSSCTWAESFNHGCPQFLVQSLQSINQTAFAGKCSDYFSLLHEIRALVVATATVVVIYFIMISVFAQAIQNAKVRRGVIVTTFVVAAILNAATSAIIWSAASSFGSTVHSIGTALAPAHPITPSRESLISLAPSICEVLADSFLDCDGAMYKYPALVQMLEGSSSHGGTVGILSILLLVVFFMTNAVFFIRYRLAEQEDGSKVPYNNFTDTNLPQISASDTRNHVSQETEVAGQYEDEEEA